MPDNINKDEYISQLESALTDILDGVGVQDLVDMTGFDEDHCQEIYDLHQSIHRK